ncbi:cytochrome c [Aurantimonas sp. MSK8Z-1]|uniref:c-type cytochrome n=1 Tax=Mangrovibrevibacter kandeliae TaxID=2968473 RepID=UPI0021187D56|nr:cytochrome c [Aurantimonas sp. MSK8Z-1]MCW4115071.1 cytochrome c [Aurantimonas sp. MSK8Z-1]
MKLARVVAIVVVIVLIGLGGFVAFAWRSEIAAIDPPQPQSFDAALVQKGATLAALGNCNSCHSAPAGKSFAGGLALPTPFGTIYSTNITPDPDTGIGRWSEAAFIRAMREGVDREGNHLYPAFPYDHFTKVTDDDDKALYAYLMTRTPVRAEAPANDLPFPLNVRLVLAGWKALFFESGPYAIDRAHDPQWNRGAYLVQGLGHCGSCHTPRNALGAEERGQEFAGGEAEGWTAYALDASSPAPVPWDADALKAYLASGWHAHHGVARGPMAEVTANLGTVPDEDVQAIATYVASVMGPPSDAAKARGDKLLQQPGVHQPGTDAQTAGTQTIPVKADGQDQGALIYAGACSSCHDAGRPLPYGGIKLNLSTAVNGPDPSNPINVILYGLPAAEGQKSPVMPGFQGVLNDGQMAALLIYMRTTFSDKPAWKDLEDKVADIRKGDREMTVHAADGTSSAPANPTRQNTSW